MAVGDQYVLGPGVINGSSPINLQGISSVRADPGFTEIMEAAAGQPDISFVGCMKNEPVLEVTCGDIALALAQVWLDGLAIPQSTTWTSYDQYWTKVAETSPRASSTAHLRTMVNKCLIVPISIDAGLHKAATLTMRIVTVYDGTNLPFAYATSVALPLTPAIAELFTVGPVFFNGTQIDGLQSWKLDFNPEVKVHYIDGEPYPRKAVMMMRKPRLSIRTKQLSYASTFGLSGTAQSATASNFYLTKMADGSTRVANGTASHCKFTMNASQGMISTREIPGSDGDNELEIIHQPRAGSSAILSKNLAVAITS